VLAFGGAFGQAVGLVLAKQGINDYDPFAANQIRVLAGMVAFVVIFTATGLWRRFFDAIRHPVAMSRTAIGAFFGPFLGVSFSLLAVQHTLTGVASTIMSINPVLILPVSYWWKKEHITLRALLGALLAVAGTAVLFS
jgi:drug/metabolite transporter (DMT)-like permease